MQINVLDYLEKTASEFPDKTALVDEKDTFRFYELEILAKAVGSAIVNKQPFSVRRPILVLADRTAATIISLIGILYSGNYYVPIDMNTPAQRLHIILKDLNQPIILCSKKDTGILNTLDNPPEHLVFEEIISTPVNTDDLIKIRKRIIDLDPVYAIFTSGSTGVPKGIAISHRSVIDLTEWLCDTFNFSRDEVLGNQTPFYFDASVKDIFICLREGITMYIIPKKLFTFPLLLLDYLNTHHITTILWATSAIVLVAASGVLDKKIPYYLKKIFFAGEAMFAKYLNIWRTYLKTALYVNLYGPTEATVDSTYYIVDRDFSDEEPIPIGRACRNLELLLLNEDRQPAEKNESGEICIRGSALALGYLNSPKQYRDAFIQNPLNSCYPDIIYRTGDIARYNEYGELVFVCRKDQQIKHMGYRIELGEIEAAVYGAKDIDGCFCFYDEIGRKIILEYTGKADRQSVIHIINNKLPKYMYPNIIIKTRHLLYNSNGKIDKKRMIENYYNESN